MSVAHTLMSRGLEVGRDLHAKYQMKENGDIHLGDVNMPKWGIALLGFTILLYILVSMSVSSPRGENRKASVHGSG